MNVHIEHLFDAPGPHPNGMQATEEGLWIVDQETNQVALVSYAGKVLQTLETEVDRGSGITVYEEALWVASTYNRKILKLDKETGATLASFTSPDPSETGAHGVEWRGNMLWIANPPSAKIYQVDVENDFQVIHSIPAPGHRPHGIAWDGDDLWCVETARRAIFCLDPKDGTIKQIIDIPEPYPEPHGMTRWNGVFWYCDDKGPICQVRLES